MTAQTKTLLKLRSAARELDMTDAEFLALVERRIVPQPVDLGGHLRWRKADLDKLGSVRVRTPDDIDWAG